MVKSQGNRLYTIIFSLLPIIMCYKVPVINMGLSTTLIAIMMIPALFFVIENHNSIKKAVLLPMIPFFIYVIYVLTKSNTTNMLLQSSVIVHFIAISAGIVDGSRLQKYLIKISVIAAFATTLQFVVHLFLGSHIQLIYHPAILDSMMEQYSSAIHTGVGRNSGMYRPSSFFLEPAHMAQYCFIGLLLSLFNNKTKKESIIITAGLLISTSGIGILMCGVCWLIWAFVKKIRGNIVTLIENLLKYGILFSMLFIALLQLPVFKRAIDRFMVKEDGEYNAVDGRLFFWDRYIGNAKTSDLIWGFGYDALPDSFFTGMMTVLYAYGYVGIILFYASLLILLFGLKGISRYIILIYIGLTFSSDVVGFIWIIYLLGVSLALNYKYSYGK